MTDTCVECGNDDACEGYDMCSECLEVDHYCPWCDNPVHDDNLYCSVGCEMADNVHTAWFERLVKS